MDPRDDFNQNDSLSEKTYAISGKIMLAAIVVLFTVVLFILLLHIYARFFWQRALASNRRRGGSSRRRRLAFSGDEDPARLRRVGLEKSVIETLPVFVYRAENFKDDALECAVCLCEFEENEKVRLLPKCNHSFHIECIDMWFDSHSTCPLCRTSAQPDPAVLQVDGSVAAVGESSGTAGEQEGSSVVITVDGNRNSDICDSCRHDEGLPSPTYPTNVLFWGTQSRVSSRNLTEGNSSRKSMGRIAVDIPPRRADSFYSPRDHQQYFSPGGPSSVKSPSTRLRSLKRILNRSVPPSPSGSVHVEQDGSDQV